MRDLMTSKGTDLQTRSFFIKGRARVTIFAAEGNARTFDYMAGDVGIVPRNMGHFIENLSDDEPLEVLEIFRAGKAEWIGSQHPCTIADFTPQTSSKTSLSSSGWARRRSAWCKTICSSTIPSLARSSPRLLRALKRM